MRLNGSWALLPGILAFAVIPIIALVNIAPRTEMGEQFTAVAVIWLVAWGVLALVGLRADYNEWLKSARYPFFELFLAEWLHRL